MPWGVDFLLLLRLAAGRRPSQGAALLGPELLDSWALTATELLDALDPDLLPDREVFERFIDSVHGHAQSEPSYWHCHAGINRSGLAVATYLHRHRGLAISDAITLIRNQRSPMALCNGLFEATLRKWYGRPDEQDFSPFTLDDYLRGRVGGN